MNQFTSESAWKTWKTHLWVLIGPSTEWHHILLWSQRKTGWNKLVKKGQSSNEVRATPQSKAPTKRIQSPSTSTNSSSGTNLKLSRRTNTEESTFEIQQPSDLGNAIVDLQLLTNLLETFPCSACGSTATKVSIPPVNGLAHKAVIACDDCHFTFSSHPSLSPHHKIMDGYDYELVPALRSLSLK